MLFREKPTKKDIIFILVIIAFTIGIMFIPSPGQQDASASERVRVRVISVDNTEVAQFGVLKTGSQILEVEVISGKNKGMVFSTTNIFTGKLELDKFFQEGDIALGVLELDVKGNPHHINIIDHYRITSIFVLLVLFIVILLLFAGWTGFKAVLSFIFTGILIWKVMIPGFLYGWNPIILALGVVTTLSAVIIFLIGGLTKKGLVAFLGTLLGVFTTCVFSIIFGNAFRIHGAVKPFSETLLYTGYGNLDLTGIFLAGIFISASGAVMDLAMDISSAMKEVVDKHPAINRKELLNSGFTVGRAVIGTMTTTLLLAYSGGFTAMLMVFIAQGIPLLNIINLTYVAAEILHTLVGSLGLVLVAPFTAIVGMLLYVDPKQLEVK